MKGNFFVSLSKRNTARGCTTRADLTDGATPIRSLQTIQKSGEALKIGTLSF
jgi:hypothetical protein